MKWKYPCDNRKQDQNKYDSTSRNKPNQSERIECETIKKEIPTFDAAEFCGKNQMSHETLDKIMEMLDIPEGRREEIKRVEEKEVNHHQESD